MATEANFRAFIYSRPEEDRAALEANALGNAFAAEVHDEYENDEQRWAVALATAKEYVDQGVTGY